MSGGATYRSIITAIKLAGAPRFRWGALNPAVSPWHEYDSGWPSIHYRNPIIGGNDNFSQNPLVGIVRVAGRHFGKVHLRCRWIRRCHAQGQDIECSTTYHITTLSPLRKPRSPNFMENLSTNTNDEEFLNGRQNCFIHLAWHQLN